MNRTNFYGNGTIPQPIVNNPSHHLARYLPNALQTSHATVQDGFTQTPTSFQKALHDEICTLNKREDELNDKIKNIDINQLTALEQQVFMREASLIEQAKQLLNLIVAEMKKCADAIVANFR